MTKTDKKREKQLIDALTAVCDQALVSVSGFQWLTHFVEFKRYPASLSIVCVMDSQSDIDRLMNGEQLGMLYRLIQDQLFAIGIQLSDIRQHVRFDSEEACEFEHAGKWNERLRQH